MRKYITIPNIFVTLGIAHSLSTSLEFNIGVIRTIYILFYAIALVLFFKVLAQTNKSNFTKMFVFLFVYTMIFGVILLVKGTDNSWKLATDPINYLIVYGQSMIPIFAFYYFSKNDMIDDKWIKIIAPFFLVCVFFEHLHLQKEILFNSTSANALEEVTNNSAYIWIALLPLIAFFKDRPVIMCGAMAVVTIIIVTTFKRGAIICALLVDCFLVLKMFQSNTKKKKFPIIIVSIVAVYVVIVFIGDFYNSNAYFNDRISTTLHGEQYSARQYMYPQYFHYFISQSNPFTFLFGNGAFATRHYLGLEAHNDWLEFAINMGLVGVVIYFLYWVKMYKHVKLTKKLVPDYIYMSIVSFMIIYFIKTMISMSINDMPFFASSIFGYCIGVCDKALFNRENSLIC